MRKILILTCLLGFTFRAGHAQEAFTFESTNDLFSVADLNGDGRRDVVVIEKATGVATQGYQNANGSFTFSKPQPTGVEGVTGLAIGRLLNGSADSLAVTGPTAGRIQLIDAPTSISVFNPLVVYPTFPVAHGLVAMDLDATATVDLVTTGDRGATLSGRFPYQGIGSVNSGPTSLFTANYTALTNQLNPARPKTISNPWMLSFYNNAANSGAWYLESITSTGVATSLLAFGTLASSHAATGFFDATNFASLLFYTPGTTTLTHRKITETASVFSLAAAQTFTLPKAIAVVVPITSGTVKMLAVVHSDGTVATYDFNGSTAPVLRQNLPGSGLEAVVPLETGGLLALTGGATPTWARYNFNGSLHVAASSGGLPMAAPLATSVSNVIYFNAEPLVSPTAAPTGQSSWQEWTTSATLAGLSVTVSGQVLGSASVGLSNAQGTTLTMPAASAYALVNQYRTDASVFSLSNRIGLESGDVTFSPPAGTYPETPPTPIPGGPAADGPGLAVRIAPTVRLHNVMYRLSPTSAWIQLPTSGLIELPARTGATLTTTIEAFSFSSNGRSPIRSATYVRTAEPTLLGGSAVVDADGDGMSDAWEKNFAVTSPTADADGDGATNLAEYQAGTDPRNPSSVPPSALLLTGNRTQNLSGSPILRLEWPTGDVSVVLESSSNLQGPWSAITSGIVTVGANYRYDVNIATPAIPKNFYRLRRP